jgi:protein gp37
MTGCTKISPGCANCYAETLTKRFHSTFVNGFNLTLHPKRLEEPKHWRKPSRIFVNSMSDLFHEDVPLDFIQEIFKVMGETPWHTYQILTKRHERLVRLSKHLNWHKNVWMGVSIESQKYAHRVDYLRQVDAKVRFLSCEPLLSPLDLDLKGIDWVIVGGESGRNARPMHPSWAQSIRDQCQKEGVAFFFKQWGGRNPKSNGRLLDGVTWDQMPSS